MAPAVAWRAVDAMRGLMSELAMRYGAQLPYLGVLRLMYDGGQIYVDWTGVAQER
jgi:hypothetical protein